MNTLNVALDALYFVGNLDSLDETFDKHELQYWGILGTGSAAFVVGTSITMNIAGMQ